MVHKHSFRYHVFSWGGKLLLSASCLSWHQRHLFYPLKSPECTQIQVCLCEHYLERNPLSRTKHSTAFSVELQICGSISSTAHELMCKVKTSSHWGWRITFVLQKHSLWYLILMEDIYIQIHASKLIWLQNHGSSYRHALLYRCSKFDFCWLMWIPSVSQTGIVWPLPEV